MKRSYRFLVSGRVQGVYYRKFIAKNMKEAGFRGFVRNLSDGRVETVIYHIGENELQKALEILKRGSPLSRVEDIVYSAIDSDDCGCDSFTIEY